MNTAFKLNDISKHGTHVPCYHSQKAAEKAAKSVLSKAQRAKQHIIHVSDVDTAVEMLSAGDVVATAHSKEGCITVATTDVVTATSIVSYLGLNK